jgi:predicted ATPase/class 3 adenylate cyclase
MLSLPVGTVTFLFTDIDGSTRLVQELGDRFGSVLETHHAILRRAISAHHGIEVSTEGDAFFAVFASPMAAVNATVAAQRELGATEWPDRLPMSVRMGLHTGDGELGGDNYVGVDVHRAARIAAAGHGGQVLLSASTRALVEATLPDDVLLRDLGQHRLKDLRAPEHLHQLVIAGLASDFPALRTLDASPTNLVAPATPLVGRNRELAELSDLLAASRMLTLIGPGGTGKTRLATELGNRARGAFSDGIFFVSLENLTERSVVASAIAQTVGARMPGHIDPEDVLAEHLANRQLLLILDNFEQVIVAASLVAQLLSRAPGLRVLVTSRVPLHVSGEQEYPVPPLEVPAAGTSIDVNAASKFDAVALFVDRARRVLPDFRLTGVNVAAVAAISRRLDGLPLAIELAAARVKMLSADAILARLEHALPLLAGGGVDLPARQQTLRAAIEWSYLLLDTAEQALFERLAVFSGGWTVESAEQVTVLDGEPRQWDVLDGLSALVDKSLVRHADGPTDEPRFEMLQLIREYAAERLAETEEAQAVERRHAEWALALAEAAAPSVEGGIELVWLEKLSREHDNLRAALRWSVEHGEREIGLRQLSGVWRFWQQRGHIREGREWLERLMPATGDEATVDAGVLAAAHTAAGGLAYWQNALEDAGAGYQAAFDLDQAHHRSDRLGDDVYNLAFVAMFRGDLETARQQFLESADLFAAAGQPERLADTIGARGALEMRTGNLDAARVLLEDARRLQLREGNRRRATDSATVLSNIYFRLGDPTAARKWLLTAITEAADVGDVARWPLVLNLGAVMAFKAGRPGDAVRLAGASAKRSAEMGGSAPNILVDVDQIVVEARAAVQNQDGPEAVDQAWLEGEQLDDDALMDLLGRADSPDPDLDANARASH